MDGQPLARRPHQPAAISLTVEQLPGGRVRFSSPQARGWAAVAQTPQQLASSLQAAFLEVQVASYSRARGEAYDLDVLTEHRVGDPLAGSPQQRARRRVGGNAPYPPEAWTKTTTDDGVEKWRSPAGRLYGLHTQAVARLVEKRSALNLPV